MISNAIPPAFIMIVGSMLIPLFKGRFKSVYMLMLPVVTFLDILMMPIGDKAYEAAWTFKLMGFDLVLSRVDPSSLIFAYAFVLVTFLGIIYILHVKNDIEYFAGLFYAGSALGVIFAGDLFTMFVFWEMLTIGAAFLILARKTSRAIRAAMRYFLVHVVGGLVLLAGIIMYINETGSSNFTHIGLSSVSTYLIFFGFGLNCAWPLMHAWLTDTYPEATIGGVVFMATFTTKTAIYVLARSFAGEDALLWIGMAMATFPIFFAVIENDLRRVLAYSLVNQVGFMVVGIGIGTDLSLNGTHAHVFSDIMFKSLLFMSVGAVMYRTGGKAKATELGGLYKSMPFTAICCMVGAASISAFPLFSGFVSKSMIMSAAAMDHQSVIWLALLFASAGVFHHAGIKIPFFAFFSHDAGIRVKEAPMNMCVAMGLTAACCIGIGTFPDATLYKLLPYNAQYEPYTAAHVIGQLALLFFSALAFTMLLLSGLYPAEMRCTNVDFDVVYRKGAKAFYFVMDKTLNTINTKANDTLAQRLPTRVGTFFDRAPSRVLSWIAGFYLRTKGVKGEHLSYLKQTVFDYARVGTFPVGITAFLAIIIIFILFWF